MQPAQELPGTNQVATQVMLLMFGPDGDIYAGANVQDEREFDRNRAEQVQRSVGAWVLSQVALALLSLIIMMMVMIL